MPKFWRQRNYAKDIFQSFKNVFFAQNHAKRHFLALILVLILLPKFVHRKVNTPKNDVITLKDVL